MDTLFELPKTEKTKSNGNTCGKCANAVRPHRYRQDWLYCKVWSCNRSQFGIKRVKSRQDSCHKFSNAPDHRRKTKGKIDE